MAEPLATYRTFEGSEYSVLQRPKGPDGKLVMRFRLPSGCGTPPPHVHPYTAEVFEVEEGRFQMLVGKEWREVKAGDSVTVEAGMRHGFRNESGAEVVIRNVHDPHHDFEAFIESVAKLSQSIRSSDPKSPSAAAKMAVIWGHHDDLIRPADPPVKAAFSVLRSIARVTRISPPD